MEKRIITTRSSLFLDSERHVFVNRVSESFKLEQHKHEFVEINYVGEGSGYQYIEGQTIPVTKGDLFYLPLGVSHVFRPSTPIADRGKLIVYNCLFDHSFAAKLADAFPSGSVLRKLLGASYPEQSWLYGHDRNGDMHKAFNTLYEEYLRQDDQYEVLIQAEIMRVLVRLYRMNRQPESGTRPNRPHPDGLIEQTTSRIQNQPGSRLLMRELAAQAGLSERQFRRRFEERSGMTFTDYVQKCRIELSCELLRSTDDKVAAIAQIAGYPDIKFFNRLFKKKTGLTPRQYRDRRLSEIASDSARE